MDQLLFNSLSWTVLSQYCVLLCKNILVAIVVFVIGKFVIKKIVAAEGLAGPSSQGWHVRRGRVRIHGIA